MVRACMGTRRGIRHRRARKQVVTGCQTWFRTRQVARNIQKKPSARPRVVLPWFKANCLGVLGAYRALPMATS